MFPKSSRASPLVEVGRNQLNFEKWSWQFDNHSVPSLPKRLSSNGRFGQG